MDTRKNENFNNILSFVLAIVTLTPTYGKSLVNAQNATEVLITTYKLPSVISPDQAELTIAELKKTEADCDDNYLRFRIRYRIGVIYLKAGMSEAAKISFEQIAHDPRCPKTTRVCSLNMVGQISRLRGEEKTALDAFEKVATFYEQNLRGNNEPVAEEIFNKLFYSALFSRAEIFEQKKNFNAGITEYDRLLNILGQGKNNQSRNGYIPLIYDRVSQLYLRQGDIDNYIKFAELLIQNYPQYYRTPIIELEIECVRFLNSVSVNPEFTDGSFTSPAQVIKYLKDSGEINSTQRISHKLDALCKQHQNTYVGILLHYHYACVLDVLGDKAKAIEVLSRVFSDNFVNPNSESLDKAVESVREYAKIQYAVTSAEMADYRQALRVLSSLQSSADNSHISELAKSVTESIHILRREVPVNDSAGK